MVEYLAPVVADGLQAVLLFGVPEKVTKDEHGSVGETDANPVMEAVRNIRAQYPGLTIACDVCLCPYTSHGHCGVLHAGNVSFQTSCQMCAKGVQYAINASHFVRVRVRCSMHCV